MGPGSVLEGTPDQDIYKGAQEGPVPQEGPGSQGMGPDGVKGSWR